ncbi:MAG: tRNA (guanosine(37)-N1)-methyltransferase TrmD [Parcubacteria group bacterium]|nr:tRNA (guanosine(37)-N1)-methyltransferase TrmD [Parcubacteria group bacterium]
MTFHVITIFPHIFDSYLNESILKRALKNNLISLKIYNLRDWTSDKHKTVDDAPFGGGAGMVMKIEPLYMALQAIKSQIPNPKSQTNSKFKIPARHASQLAGIAGRQNSKFILLSAKGKTWNQKLAKSHAKLDNIILICGRYEGVDERITKFIDEEISVGDYVLTGGEIGALAIIDSITRLLPGTLGNADSAKFESHTIPGLLEYPQYTRPEIFTANGKSYRVPKVLLSGDHKKIAAWRAQKSKHI